VKLDWCVPDGSVSQRERTTAFAAALDKTGREMWLNFHCKGAYQDWCAADGNSWRIGEDHHDIWSNTRDVIATLATVNRNNQTGPHRWADPDFLMTGGAGCDVNVTAARCPGQTNDEVGSHTITVTSDNTTLTADAFSPSQSRATCLSPCLLPVVPNGVLAVDARGGADLGGDRPPADEPVHARDSAAR
jgi:hypothetical protein